VQLDTNTRRSDFAGIYGIVDREVGGDPFAILDAMLDAGISIVQYRAKAGVSRDIVRAMHVRTRAAGARLIVNDDLEAALEADGVHLGQEDLAGNDIGRVRARLGSRLLGVSCGVPAEARVAEAAGADYVGVGPYNATASKDDAGAAIGPAGLAAVVRATRLPVVAIGGIGCADIPAVAASGAAMAAVISAIARAEEPQTAARALVRTWADAVASRRS
jgi:thiamine-phosphate pyrophosphorylase